MVLAQVGLVVAWDCATAKERFSLSSIGRDYLAALSGLSTAPVRARLSCFCTLTLMWIQPRYA